MQTSVFRKSSLEQLSSPEQLDQLMRVATPKGWVVLFALLALIGVAIVWGIFGSVSVTVQGNGILMKSGGIAVNLDGRKVSQQLATKVR